MHTLALPHIAAPIALFTGPAMAVDEGTGRLFIANGGDNSVSVLDTARL
jgi:DNA-binding beta-propeller fold protein YncE